ncbi:LANO_0F04566g1_1 [Lachancea nothofagi CBS 11611]|uniref:LANO_0F04566g1_1 n=1 Tax=Lachancea nothofagi CBS 11611 TaxID=1266666 RepID=A0A1G4K7N9_9SACH|nr:LANO_0F04566g1_1 [Lachancea nothofagi CBS 11611]
MATSKADLSAEQRRLVHVYYRELRDFFQVTGAKHDRSSSARAQKARSKLLKLYASQFFELSTDVHDELQRRIDENQTQPDHLLPKDTFHVKRNQARQKLANLSESRFNDLVDDILYEIQRRDYHVLPSPETPLSPLRKSHENDNTANGPSPPRSALQLDLGNTGNNDVALPQVLRTQADQSNPTDTIPGERTKNLSNITPNATVQQSQVIPKKASIEWSSDEDEDDLKTVKPGLHEDLNETRMQGGHEQLPLSSTKNQENLSAHAMSPESKLDGENFAKSAGSLKDSDESELEGPTGLPHGATLQSEFSKTGHNVERDGSHEEQYPRGVNRFTASSSEIEGLNTTEGISTSPRKSWADNGTNKELERSLLDSLGSDQGNSNGKAEAQSQLVDYPESQQSSRSNSLLLQRKSEKKKMEDSIQRTSPLKTSKEVEASYQGPSDSASNMSSYGQRGNSGPFHDADESIGNMENQLRHWGSLKRVSLDRENSKREIEVLVAEGTKMDQKITELEKSNMLLSSARANLESDMHLYKNENEALKEHVESITKSMESVNVELVKLKEESTESATQSKTLINENHQKQFTTLTKQINSLSIENEQLKQMVAELELKLKGFKSSDRSNEGNDSNSTMGLPSGTTLRKQIDFSSDSLEKFVSSDGQIPKDLLLSFNAQIDSIFDHLHGDKSVRTFGYQLFDDLAHIADSVHKMIRLIDVPAYQEPVLVLKASLSHGITSVRFFAIYHDVLPLVTVASAISDISFAVCCLIDVVKVTGVEKDAARAVDHLRNIPQTPTLSGESSASNQLGMEIDNDFKDPRDSTQHTQNAPATMSPVKPLKITQKVGNNSPPPRNTHASRKPSSTLFASIVNPNTSSHTSPRNSQFSRSRSDSSTEKPGAKVGSGVNDEDGSARALHFSNREDVLQASHLHFVEGSGNSKTAEDSEKSNSALSSKEELVLSTTKPSSDLSRAISDEPLNNLKNTGEDLGIVESRRTILNAPRAKGESQGVAEVTSVPQAQKEQSTDALDTTGRGQEAPISHSKVRPNIFEKLRKQSKLREVDPATSSGDETMDEHESHKNDDSNLTSDDDLTYQALKDSMRKKQLNNDTGIVTSGCPNTPGKTDIKRTTHSPYKSQDQKDSMIHQTAKTIQNSDREIVTFSKSAQGLHKEGSERAINNDGGEGRQAGQISTPVKSSNSVSSEPERSSSEKENESQAQLQNQFSPTVRSGKTQIKTQTISIPGEAVNTSGLGGKDDKLLLDQKPTRSQMETKDNVTGQAYPPSLVVKLEEEDDWITSEKEELPITEAAGAMKQIAGASNLKNLREPSTPKIQGIVKKEENSDASPQGYKTQSHVSSAAFTKPLVKVEEFQSSEKDANKTLKQENTNDWIKPSSGKYTSAEELTKSNTDTVDKESEDESDFDIDAFDIENPDNTLSELLLYLEHRTIEVISTIQSLLTSIKQPQASKGALCKDSSAINLVIAQMVEATNVSMAQSRNAALKEHGNWVVQSLKDCKRRMTSLCHLNGDGTINIDESDDEYADKHFKQRLAGIAFDVAKCTKELVKTVEEASLKEEIEYLNSKLAL